MKVRELIDPLIYPGMPTLRPACPHCGATQVNKRAQYHYEAAGFRKLVPVRDGEICDRCGGLIPDA